MTSVRTSLAVIATLGLLGCAPSGAGGDAAGTTERDQTDSIGKSADAEAGSVPIAVSSGGHDSTDGHVIAAEDGVPNEPLEPIAPTGTSLSVPATLPWPTCMAATETVLVAAAPPTETADEGHIDFVATAFDSSGTHSSEAAGCMWMEAHTFPWSMWSLDGRVAAFQCACGGGAAERSDPYIVMCLLDSLTGETTEPVLEFPIGYDTLIGRALFGWNSHVCAIQGPTTSRRMACREQAALGDVVFELEGVGYGSVIGQILLLTNIDGALQWIGAAPGQLVAIEAVSAIDTVAAWDGSYAYSLRTSDSGGSELVKIATSDGSQEVFQVDSPAATATDRLTITPDGSTVVQGHQLALTGADYPASESSPSPLFIWSTNDGSVTTLADAASRTRLSWDADRPRPNAIPRVMFTVLDPAGGWDVQLHDFDTAVTSVVASGTQLPSGVMGFVAVTGTYSYLRIPGEIVSRTSTSTLHRWNHNTEKLEALSVAPGLGNWWIEPGERIAFALAKQGHHGPDPLDLVQWNYDLLAIDLANPTAPAVKVVEDLALARDACGDCMLFSQFSVSESLLFQPVLVCPSEESTWGGF